MTIIVVENAIMRLSSASGGLVKRTTLTPTRQIGEEAYIPTSE